MSGKMRPSVNALEDALLDAFEPFRYESNMITMGPLKNVSRQDQGEGMSDGTVGKL
jgi:hypothetical protein